MGVTGWNSDIPFVTESEIRLQFEQTLVEEWCDTRLIKQIIYVPSQVLWGIILHQARNYQRPV